MSVAGAIPRIAMVLTALSLAACAVVDAPESDFTRMPREVRLGTAEMAIVRVEQDVSPVEVAEAVQGLINREGMCLPWPGIWLAALDNRRNVYFARYDLMARDWGEDVAAASEQRMQEFVALGFLLARERPDIGARVVEYTLTTDGDAYLRGSPYGGERPAFCAPSQRRLVEVTSMEWGDYPCGSLRVRFTHVADDWPTWARTEDMRARVAATWAPLGQVTEGAVTLGRQWYRRAAVPPGFRNGSLQSVCFDRDRQQIVGDDLELTLPPS